MKKGVLILLDILYPAGAEHTAVNIAVRLKESKNYSPVVCATREGGVLEQTLISNDVKFFILGRKNKFQFHKFLPLKEIVKNENIRIIHAHKIGSNFWGSILGTIFNLPSVLHYQAHQPEVRGHLYYLESKLINLLCTKIISISQFETERLIRQEGISRSKIVTIHNSIDYKKYTVKSSPNLRNDLCIKPNSPIVGMVAAFRPQKNHELFLLAAREILKDNQDAIFLLVGDGPTKEKIERMASELGIKNNCIFTGLRKDIPDIISIMDVCALATHWEGLPLCVLEYMALYKAVVCSNVSGLSELIENDVNGFLVPPGDYHTFAEKITTLINDKELSSKLGKNAFSTVKEKFSEDTMMDRIENLYDEILSNNR